jgi:conjugative relaxase-like TrwC/TraI family protein
MAWFRAMGANEVAYHEATVLGRADDHAGLALDYYGSRGETPLRWGGAGAARLGLSAEVTPESYEAAFGPAGFRHPASGTRLVGTRRPGFELVVSAHKSVAVLGVIGDADAMHSILDVETAATMEWLDGWFQERGGRRGREQTRTATGGLTYAVTRHATSRAGDPSPHDHVLVANVVEMLDDLGGFKALDSAALRDTVEAATMVGRLHSAHRAVQLGFDIEPDPGPSGHLRHWKIVGIPDSVCELFSKRSDEIGEHLASTGQRGYRARSVAARATRSLKRHTGVDELLPAWQEELVELGWPVERLVEHLAQSHAPIRTLRFPLTTVEIDRLAGELLGVDGRLLANHKIFTRTHLIAELAPRLYGHDPAELDRVLEHIAASPAIVPLIGVTGVREQCFTTVEVLTAEHTIAGVFETLTHRTGPTIDEARIAAASSDREHGLGRPLTAGQRRVVEQVCGRGAAVSVVIGVAGSGKTTALDAVTTVLEDSGYRVLGTSTSGQAARTLAAEAHVDAVTFASLLWRLDHGHVRLDSRTVVIVDETGMADDANLARLALAVQHAHASLVLVGDPHQLDAVGPGGALATLIARHPELTVTLDHNVRQRNPEERLALAELRDGNVATAIDWYANAGRLHTQSSRVETLATMTESWAHDIADGNDSALLAWRRGDVDDLNRLARAQWERLGRLRGDDVEVVPGRRYAVGDQLVALAPNPDAGIVTSEQLTVTANNQTYLSARTSLGRTVLITGDGLDAEHLDYGYALTVHRAQGATVERAHVLAAGGGRELAYVALSRAREQTHVYATADTLEQAVDDLKVDWTEAHHQRWISGTSAQRGEHPEPVRAAPEPPAVVQPAPFALAPAERLRALTADYDDLHAGTGRWTDTTEGVSARALRHARTQLHDAQSSAVDPHLRRRDRRNAAKSLDSLAATLDQAERYWHRVGEPMAERLCDQIVATRHEVEQLRVTEARRHLDRQLTSRHPGPDLGRDLGMSLEL